jgi:hypothetical protein
MKKSILNFTLFPTFIFLAACGGSNKPDDEASSLDSVEVVEEDTLQSQVLYNVPSPSETFSLLKGAGAAFDKSLLNPPDKISKYVTTFSKATNLGVYSTDLSFCLLYKQNQDVNIYLKNVSELTAALSIDGNFIQSAVKRINANTDNLDSLKEVISEVSVNSKLFLNENKMNNTIAMMAAGNLIEAIYLVTNIAEKTKNKEIISLVADQKYSINNLIKELEKFQSDKDIADLLVDIKDVAAVYETLTEGPVTAAEPKDKGIVSIGSNTALNLSNEQLKLIQKKITAVRNKIVL